MRMTRFRLLKQILSEQNIDDKQTPAKLFSAIIQSWKDQGLTPDKVTDAAAGGGHAVKIYRLYQERLRAPEHDRFRRFDFAYDYVVYDVSGDFG